MATPYDEGIQRFEFQKYRKKIVTLLHHHSIYDFRFTILLTPTYSYDFTSANTEFKTFAWRTTSPITITAGESVPSTAASVAIVDTVPIIFFCDSRVPFWITATGTLLFPWALKVSMICFNLFNPIRMTT